MSFSTLTFITCLATLIQSCIAGYAMVDDYSGSNFFDKFSFFTEPDPTNGFVQYVDQATAQSSGLISQDGQSITMGVDSTNVTPSGRPSVRITSDKIYNHGLIILDASHMPVGCGTWPAFWTVGPNWPANGEIDIIEGVNTQSSNSMTLHTGPSCSIQNNGVFSGQIVTPNCDVDAYGQPTNAGCSIDTANTQSFGSGFNAAQGGVYATEWTSDAISIYFFPRSQIPSDISSGKPDPTSWGKPYASFQGACDLDTNFKDQQIVFDTTFCGDWAGNVWGSDSTCSAQASSCEDYVANNPTAFQNAFWKVNSLKVYQTNGDSSEVSQTNAGPTGIAPSVPPVISSAAPIPVSSQDVATTFVWSTTPAATWASASSQVDSWTSPAGVVPSPTPSYTQSVDYGASATPSWGEFAAATPTPSSSYVQSVDVAPTPTPTPTSTVVEAAQFSSTPVTSAQPLQASWFPDGGQGYGIPATAVPYQRHHARHIMAHKRAVVQGANALAVEGPAGKVHVHHRRARAARFGLS